MDEATYTRLITASLTGELTAKEKADLDAWLAEDPQHKAILEEYQKVWAAGEELPDYMPDIDKARNRLMAVLDEAEAEVVPSSTGGKVIAFPQLKPLLRYAAVLVGVVLCWWVYQQWNTDDQTLIATGPDQEQEVTLPDGSVVLLNRNSQLGYSAAFEQRTVTLEGEAFFDVTSDAQRPFSIQSGKALTTVLGTQFSVRAYPADETVRVAVAEGKVRLEETDQGTNVILEQGETGHYTRQSGEVKRQTSLPANVFSWKENSIVFNDVNVVDLLNDLSDYYGVRFKIVDESIKNCNYTGKFPNKSLADVIAVLESSSSFEFTEKNGLYEVGGTACP